MARRKFDEYIPSVYVVAWPDGIWKVGYSGNPTRWLTYPRADLVHLFEFGERPDAEDFEFEMSEAFRDVARRAFRRRDEALRYIHGTNASGWTECYRVSPWCAKSEAGESYVDQVSAVFARAWGCLDRDPTTYDSFIPYWQRPAVFRGNRLPILVPEMWAAA